MGIDAGTILDERFRVDRLLGTGAAARVFAATDLRRDTPVAVKVLRTRGDLADPARFEAEISHLRDLDHPHILKVLAAGTTADESWLVTELAPGGALIDVVPEGGLGERRALEIATQVLEALAHAHARGVIHRDVKPENILLDERGDALLADFGLAKGMRSTARTGTGVVLGTPEYLAPEVLQGEAATPASDLFSWGALLFFLLNGEPPVEGSPQDIARARFAGELRAGREGPRIREVLLELVRRDPAARPDAARLRALLRGAATPDPGGISEATRMVESEEVSAIASAPTGRHAPVAPWRTPAAAAGFLALLATVAVLLPRGGPASPPPPSGPAPRLEDPAEVAARWAARLRDFHAGIVLGELHARVFPPREGYQAAMLQARNHEAPREVDFPELTRARRTLRWREELAADRPRLGGALLDDAVPPETRRALFVALQKLDVVDGYYEGWGVEAPYGVSGLLRAFADIRVVDHDAGWFPRAPPPPDTPPPRGRHHLFSWTRPWDQDFP